MKLQMFRTDTDLGVDCDRNIISLFELRNILPLAVVQECSHPLMDFDSDFGDVVAVGVRHQKPHDVNCHAFRRFDLGRSGATGAVFVNGPAE